MEHGAASKLRAPAAAAAVGWPLPLDTGLVRRSRPESARPDGNLTACTTSNARRRPRLCPAPACSFVGPFAVLATPASRPPPPPQVTTPRSPPSPAAHLHLHAPCSCSMLHAPWRRNRRRRPSHPCRPGLAPCSCIHDPPYRPQTTGQAKPPDLTGAGLRSSALTSIRLLRTPQISPREASPAARVAPARLDVLVPVCKPKPKPAPAPKPSGEGSAASRCTARLPALVVSLHAAEQKHDLALRRLCCSPRFRPLLRPPVSSPANSFGLDPKSKLLRSATHRCRRRLPPEAIVPLPNRSRATATTSLPSDP